VKARLETGHLDIDDTSGDLATLFITAREVAGCTTPDGQIHMLPSGPWVVHQQVLAESVNELLDKAQGYGRDAMVAANAFGREIQKAMIGSFRSDSRYELGTLDVVHTDFATRRILTAIEPESVQGRRPLAAAIKRVRASLAGDAAARLTAADLDARKQLTQLLGIRPTVQAVAARGPAKKRRG